MDEIWVIAAVVIGVMMMAFVLAVGCALIVRDTMRKRGRWGINLQSVRCPQCGEPAPVVRVPRNRRQMLWGGCTCVACGLEYDKWGRAVDEQERA